MVKKTIRMTDKMTDITQKFSLSDVIVGSTIMTGYAGCLGRKVTGRVSRILPGICFEVSVGDGKALLWRSYQLESETTKEQGLPDRPEEYKDMQAVVDCDFWAAQGVKPLFLANESDCFPDVLPLSPTEQEALISAFRPLARSRGKQSLNAWAHQILRIRALQVSEDRSPATPTRAPAERVCPDAPIKKRRIENEEDVESDFEDADETDEEEDSDFEDEDDEEEEMAEEAEAEEEAEDTYIPHINLFGTPRLTNLFREALESEYHLTISGKHFLTFIVVLAIAVLVAIARTR